MWYYYPVESHPGDQSTRGRTMKLSIAIALALGPVVTGATCNTTDPLEDRPFGFTYDVPEVEEFDLYGVELEVLSIERNLDFPGLLVTARIVEKNEIEALPAFDPEHMHIKFQTNGRDQWFTIDQFEYFVRQHWCVEQ